MADERIEEGFEVFVSDDHNPFGAVRQVKPHGKPELVIYVENAGDFTIPLDVIKAVHSQKVIVDCDKLNHGLRKAVGHAHDAEDPRILRRPIMRQRLQHMRAEGGPRCGLPVIARTLREVAAKRSRRGRAAHLPSRWQSQAPDGIGATWRLTTAHTRMSSKT